ncbi:hypothetical protein T492DRAFT_1054368 [Pavlovales sp. CCMP2436]|nr:hypothetical protein T492DRAFT_1054368 [Pavlovales sp. CCMP2436]
MGVEQTAQPYEHTMELQLTLSLNGAQPEPSLQRTMAESGAQAHARAVGSLSPSRSLAHEGAADEAEGKVGSESAGEGSQGAPLLLASPGDGGGLTPQQLPPGRGAPSLAGGGGRPGGGEPVETEIATPSSALRPQRANAGISPPYAMGGEMRQFGIPFPGMGTPCGPARGAGGGGDEELEAAAARLADTFQGTAHEPQVLSQLD